MQSVFAARWLLHFAAVLLAIVAMSSQSWDVIDLHAPRNTAARSINTTTVVSINSSSNSSNTSSDNAISSDPGIAVAPASPSPQWSIEKVTFAPGRYCFHRKNATRECHEYAFLLNRIGGPSSSSSASARAKSNNGQVAIHAASEQEILMAATSAGKKDAEHERIDRVLTSWCMIQQDGSWFVQGAESMMCLVVLDISLYTMVFWVLFGALATLLSLISYLWPVLTGTIEPVTAFCSYTTATLGFFLLVEWWGYGAYFIDIKYLQSLSLSWRYGSAFKLLCGSVLLSMVAARITLKLSISTRTNYAQLFAAPPPSSSELPTPSNRNEVLSPAVPQRQDECQDDENADPLQCPANYHV